jgi:hypothetical protein
MKILGWCAIIMVLLNVIGIWVYHYKGNYEASVLREISAVAWCILALLLLK